MSAGTVALATPQRLLTPGWPLLVLFVGYPVWFVLGFAPFAWVIMAVPMAASLAVVRPLRVPRGIGLWCVFLAWMLLSALALEGQERYVGFVWRALQYASMTTLLLYVYNLPRPVFPTRRGIGVLASFWVVVVLGGLLAFPLRHVELPSLSARLIPRGLLANDFVSGLVTPSFAQNHTFLGFPIPRPTAPFQYTNSWGSAFALTLPFFLALLAITPAGGKRTAMRVLLAVSIIPAIVSVNRGMWLSLIVGMFDLALRAARRGRPGPLKMVALFVSLTAVLVIFTPLRTVVSSRIENPHSNEGRQLLAEQTVERSLGSPVIGYGAPRPAEGERNLPSAGTQGQLWFVMFSHGIPALLVFLGFFFHLLWRMRREQHPVVPWARMTVVMALVQMPAYGLVGAELHIVFFAVALALREIDRPDGAGVRP